MNLTAQLFLRVLPLLGLATSVLPLSGCIIDTSSGGGSCASQRYVTFAWRDGDGAVLNCSAVGASTVRLNLGNLSYDFSCQLGAATISQVASGAYTVDAQLLAANGQVLSESPPESFLVPSCAPLDLGTYNFPVDTCAAERYVYASWSISEVGTGLSLTCAQVPATTVRMTINGTPYDFPCSDYEGATESGLQSGNYNIGLELRSSTGAVLSQTTTPSFFLPTCAPLNRGAIVFDVN